MKESIGAEISSQISYLNRGTEGKYEGGATPSLLSSSNIQSHISSHLVSQFDSYTQVFLMHRSSVFLPRKTPRLGLWKYCAPEFTSLNLLLDLSKRVGRNHVIIPSDWSKYCGAQMNKSTICVKLGMVHMQGD
jgi:hypothetical protein